MSELGFIETAQTKGVRVIDFKRMSEAPTDGTHIIAYGKHENDCGDECIGFCEVYHDGVLGWYNITYYPSEPEFWFEVPQGYKKQTRRRDGPFGELVTTRTKGSE